MDKKSFDTCDVIVLEADGRIDGKNGYGYPIQERYKEFNIKTSKFNLKKNFDKLEELPAKPMLISGGMTEVTSDIEWITVSKESIGKIVTSNQKQKNLQTPLLGICFGAQLIAEAYQKGSVFYLDDPEIGLSSLTLEMDNHPIFKSIETSFDAYSFHYNQIKSTKFNVISKTDYKEEFFLQAFEIPDSKCFGVQFHPDFKYNEMVSLFKFYKPVIKELGFDLDPIIKTLPKLNNSKILYNFFSEYGKTKK